MPRLSDIAVRAVGTAFNVRLHGLQLVEITSRKMRDSAPRAFTDEDGRWWEHEDGWFGERGYSYSKHLYADRLSAEWLALSRRRYAMRQLAGRPGDATLRRHRPAQIRLDQLLNLSVLFRALGGMDA